MSNISLTVTANGPDEMISDLQRLFPTLGAGLPPMQEQPSREPASQPDKTTRTRKTKEDVKGDVPLPDGAATAELSGPASGSKDGAVDTSGAASKGTTASPSDAVPDIDTVRAKLKALAAAKGEDDVFKLLGKFKAKSASTVAETDRANLIAEIDAALGDA